MTDGKTPFHVNLGKTPGYSADEGNVSANGPAAASPAIIPARRPDSLRFADPRFVVVRCSRPFERTTARCGPGEDGMREREDV